MMTSMMLTKAEADDEVGAPSTIAEDAPAYPYGLTISLNDEVMTKLGMTDMPKMGTDMTMVAMVCVISCGMDEMQDGDKEMRMTLQITDMDLKTTPGPSDAEVFYKASPAAMSSMKP